MSLTAPAPPHCVNPPHIPSDISIKLCTWDFVSHHTSSCPLSSLITQPTSTSLVIPHCCYWECRLGPHCHCELVLSPNHCHWELEITEAATVAHFHWRGELRRCAILVFFIYGWEWLPWWQKPPQECRLITLPCYCCHGYSPTNPTLSYHNDYILPQIWLQLLRLETSMSIMANGSLQLWCNSHTPPKAPSCYSRFRHSCCHSYDTTTTTTTVMHCPRPSQLFRIQAFLLPLLSLLLPAKLTAILVADIAILLEDIHSYGNLRAFIWLWLPHY